MEAKVQRLFDLKKQYAALTVDEIWDHFLAHHHSLYITEIQNLDCDMDIKVKLMQRFFDNQNDIIQAQQTFSPRPPTGPPIPQAGPSSIGTEEPADAIFEVTRSGRICKKPMFLQQSLLDSPVKRLTPKSKVEKYSPSVTHQSKTDLETEKIFAEYKSPPSSFIQSDFLTTNTKEKGAGENGSETSLGIAKAQETKPIKPNQFFKSKNPVAKQLEIIKDDDSKDEDWSESNKRSGKSKKTVGVSRTAKKRKVVSQEQLFPCPVCRKDFAEHEINIHVNDCCTK